MKLYLAFVLISVSGLTMLSAACDESYSPTQQRQTNFERSSAKIEALQHRKCDVIADLRLLNQLLEPSAEEQSKKETLAKQLSGVNKAIKKLLKQRKQLEDVKFEPDYPDLT